MIGARATPIDRTRGTRLLALLLALLLSVTSLAGHAAMEACAPDCTVAQSAMVDASEVECAACAILPALTASPTIAPDGRVTTSDPVFVHQFPSPPKRPPKT